MVYYARAIACAVGTPLADERGLVLRERIAEPEADPAADDTHRACPDTPLPDPFDDADALEELGDEIATLAAHIHAATHRMLLLIADFDRRRGWELGGHRSCAGWLAFRTGIDLGTAREKVRAARALVGLPETSASMARGELSFSQVRALTRVATPENEADLLDLARGCTTAQIERLVRGWKQGSGDDEETLERERFEGRTLSVFPDEEGMYLIRGRLPAEVGALLMRAIEAASDALYRNEHTLVETMRERERSSERGSERAAARRRADAIGLLAERALAAGFGDQISGTRAERYQVVLHVERETLQAEGEPGRSELEDGTRVSSETSRRLSCDASLVEVKHAKDGEDERGNDRGRKPSDAQRPDAAPRPLGPILNVGRRTRTIPPALRRALEYRDQGCRFPGCGLRFTGAHHVKHWADGGETSLGNCLLLCRYHHRLVHEGGWQVQWWGEGRPVFFGPRGQAQFDGRWRPPEPHPKSEVSSAEHGDAAAIDHVDRTTILIEENQARGVSPHSWTAGARWKREAEIPDEIYFRSMEALV